MHIGKNVGWIVKNTPLRAEQLLRDDPHNLQMHVVIVQLAFECANCVSLARLLLAAICILYVVLYSSSSSSSTAETAAIPVIAPSFPVTAREIRLLL